MAVRQTPVCDRCDQEIHPNPVLGDLQGGPVEVRFPAFTVELDLCEECMDELYVEFGQHGRRGTGGAAKGADQLLYLPVVPAE